MTNKPYNKKYVNAAYHQRATKYDLILRIFNIFSLFGFNILGWRKQAISRLNLKPGDTVIDIGCGTGINFPFLYQAVTSSGKIIGLDLSEEMLLQAKQIIEKNQWRNVHLVCGDAAQYEFPSSLDAVLSTYTLILIPDCEIVVSNACKSLVPGGRFVVLDMAWPRYCPIWWRHVLFFLRSYGVTYNVIRRRPWENVQKSMEELLQYFSKKQFWFGFFYLASGVTPKVRKKQT